MQKLSNQEKTGLLLASTDEEDEENPSKPKISSNEQFSIVSHRPRSYDRRRGPSMNHPVFLFTFLLGSFVFGCLSGVLIMLYRISQDNEIRSFPSQLLKVDSTIQRKMFQSINQTQIHQWNHSIQSEFESINRVENSWKSFSTIKDRLNKFSYDVTLSKSSGKSQWNGIELVDENNFNTIEKYSSSSKDDFVTLSSLVKSATINSHSIYYLNYGRPEDLAFLIQRNVINWDQKNETIVFMRRKSTIISPIEQIRQAIRYQFAALVLFDDDDDDNQQEQRNDRLTFSQEFKRLKTEKERQRFLEDFHQINDDSIPVLVLSPSDVKKIFSSVQSDSNGWLPSPSQWHFSNQSISLGGPIQKKTLRFIVHLEEIPVRLPNLIASIRGSIDEDHFIMVAFQLAQKQQENVIEEILRAFDQQIQSGWKPKRSILFCAWSGFAYDRYSVRRWMIDNSRLINRNLIAYIDLGEGIRGNSTLNLRGSPLLEQIALRAADSVVSPLVHNHLCHRRQSQMIISHQHDHQRRRRRRHSDDHQTEENPEDCERHKLLDEWIRASHNRIEQNQSHPIVQMIDANSNAALFQLQFGIPSLIVEMTDEKAVNNDTFYATKSSIISNDLIQPEVAVAYTQFIAEVMRQLVDEPLIPFNLTHYGMIIEKETNNFLHHFNKSSHPSNVDLANFDELKSLANELSNTIRFIEFPISQTAKDNYAQIQKWNEKLIEFERLFVPDDLFHRSNTLDDSDKHILFGRAFGLTNGIVPYSTLSNLLFDLDENFEKEFHQTIESSWLKLKKSLRSVLRSLHGLEGLLKQN